MSKVWEWILGGIAHLLSGLKDMAAGIVGKILATFGLTMVSFNAILPSLKAFVVDRISGEILIHKVKEVRVSGSLESLVSNLATQRSDAARRFEKQLESQKDRARLLEEKFREALERAEKSDEKHINPMDMD